MSVCLQKKATWTHPSNLILHQGYIQHRTGLTFKCVKQKATTRYSQYYIKVFIICFCIIGGIAWRVLLLWYYNNKKEFNMNNNFGYASFRLFKRFFANFCFTAITLPITNVTLCDTIAMKQYVYGIQQCIYNKKNTIECLNMNDMKYPVLSTFCRLVYFLSAVFYLVKYLPTYI